MDALSLHLCFQLKEDPVSNTGNLVKYVYIVSPTTHIISVYLSMSIV